MRGASVIERYFGHETARSTPKVGSTPAISPASTMRATSASPAAPRISSSRVGSGSIPGEIEAIVGALPEVALVAVMGRAHAKWGERPILIVEPRKGAQISDEALLDALRTRVAGWWLPDAIVRVSAMPLATGKIDKSRLRAEHG